MARTVLGRNLKHNSIITRALQSIIRLYIFPFSLRIPESFYLKSLFLFLNKFMSTYTCCVYKISPSLGAIQSVYLYIFKSLLVP